MEEASQLRSQLDVRLRQAAAGEAAESDEAALTHGREVWARCEALTSGDRASLIVLASFSSQCVVYNAAMVWLLMQ